jgi:hypothetical protein
MTVFVIVSGHSLGSTDAAYLHGVFSTREKAETAAQGVDSGVVVECQLDALLEDVDSYHGIQGNRII